MGEFPDPAIRGSTAPPSTDTATPTPVPTRPIQPVDPGPSTELTTEATDEGVETSTTPTLTLVVSSLVV
jgi:hypothetical protein